MVSAAHATRQDMVNFHDFEGEMDITANADTFLLAVKTMAVRAIIGQLAHIRAQGRLVEHDCAAPERAPIVADALVNQLYG